MTADAVRVDARLERALREQLRRRDRNAVRVGWKVGAGDRERIGGGIVAGHLTQATTIAPGARYVGGGEALHADAEVALHIGAGGEVSGYGAALELVDLAGDDDAERIVAENVFHRAVAFGPARESLPGGQAALIVNGDVRAVAPIPRDVADRAAELRRILSAVDEDLRVGDRVITGSVVQVPVAAGDEVVADMGELGRVELSVA